MVDLQVEVPACEVGVRDQEGVLEVQEGVEEMVPEEADPVEGEEGLGEGRTLVEEVQGVLDPSEGDQTDQET